MSATADARGSPLCRAHAKPATAWRTGKSSKSATAATAGTTTGSRQSKTSRLFINLRTQADKVCGCIALEKNSQII